MAVELICQGGFNLALCARRMEKLEAIKTALLQANPIIHLFLRPLDVTQANDIFEVF